MAALSAQEKQYYDQLFDSVNKDDTGVLPGSDALPFLSASGLPQQTLGEIWAVADPDNNGFLTKDGWYKVARIVGWLQKGNQTQVDPALANKLGPYPTFNGFPGPPQQPSMASAPSGSSAGTGGPILPQLTASDRTKFTRIFVGCGPANGLVSGDKARDVFLKSQLNYDKLGQIWNLADTQQRGALDLTDFIIGMYLIQSCMANSNLTLPATLPAGTYEAASGGRPPVAVAPIAMQQTGPTSPIQRQFTGPMQPQVTGQSLSGPTGTPPRSRTMTPSRQSTFNVPPSSSAGSAMPWDVTAEAKATSDRFFSQLDPHNNGVIDGDVAVPFMVQSQLDEDILANIWDLADIRQEGKLDRDEFAVAMYLINAKLGGQSLPSALPMSLIPPRLRHTAGHDGQQPSAASKDLFDVFSDGPEPATPIPAQTTGPFQPQSTVAFQPQSTGSFHAQNAGPFQSGAISAGPQAFLSQPPSRRGTGQDSSRQQQRGGGPAMFAPATTSSPQPAADLLGDDAADVQASSVPDHSADIGNTKNQLANTTRAVNDLEKSRVDLERSAASNASQLEQLETELTAARAKHETETKAVSELRVRVGEQTARLKQLQGDVIAAESDVTAMRMEKDELEQTLLRDKEEVRGLHKRMKEFEDEKTGLKLLLDKIKKEARQQKGMVSIAKKQVSTAEGSRDAVQSEIREAEKAAQPAPEAVISPTMNTATGVPLPFTPQALSPEATGASQRSNNPFTRNSIGRVNSAGSEQSGPSPAAVAGLGAVAGVAAGALTAGSLQRTSTNTSDTAATPKLRAESPAVGAASGEMTPTTVAVDPFGAPTSAKAEHAYSAQPAGADPAAADDPFSGPLDGPAQSTAFDDDGFGDSFGAEPAAAAPRQIDEQASSSNPTDFDAAFADFDTETEDPQRSDGNPQLSGGESASTIPVPIGISKAALGDLGRPDNERSASTQAIAPSSNPHTPPAASAPPLAQAEDEFGANESSDEDEGPEDLEVPRRGYSGQEQQPGDSDDSRGMAFTPGNAAAVAAAPVTSPTAAGFPMGPPSPKNAISSSTEDGQAKARRSAPPPPARGSTGPTSPTKQTSFDAFGAPVGAAAVGVGAAAAVPSLPNKQEAFDPFGAPAVGSTSSVPTSPARQSAFDPFGAPAIGSNAPVPASPTNQAAFDPFGAPATAPSTAAQVASDPPSEVQGSSAPTLGAVAIPKTSMFDDEDEFDFSDMPPTGGGQQVNTDQPANAANAANAANQLTNTSSAFDDEFASFDDDFDKPSSQLNTGSDNSNSLLQTYEVVPPKTEQDHAPKGFDEWGLNQSKTPAAAGQGNPLSFDDAFGNDFEPASAAQPADAGAVQQSTPQPPALPHRPSAAGGDLPQSDDLEDVKKLCAMGFPRSLVVEALDANGYDFQKALNVLLVK